MKKTLLLSGAFAAILLAATGCQNTVNTMRGTAESGLDEVALRKFVSDGFCNRRLLVTSVQAAHSEGGPMELQIGLRNERTGVWDQFWSWMTGENPYYVNYKIDWFDERGIMVSSPQSVWLTEIFYPGETKFVKSTAPNDKSTEYMVSFKEKNH